MTKKLVILAGGLGTRISEETQAKPKPMVEIGGKPIIWHIMKYYSYFGVNEFIICCGYKGYMLKEFFHNYFLHLSDVVIDVKNNNLEILRKEELHWKISLIDTGENTQTGGRLKKISKYIDSTFFMTYGDGLSDINISELLSFHQDKNKFCTVSAVNPPARFGALTINSDSMVTSFNEKPKGDGQFINGGFFVLEPSIFDYIPDDDFMPWENLPMHDLAKNNQLAAYKHMGFWQPMDTLREKNILEVLWINNVAPWKLWND